MLDIKLLQMLFLPWFHGYYWILPDLNALFEKIRKYFVYTTLKSRSLVTVSYCKYFSNLEKRLCFLLILLQTVVIIFKYTVIIFIKQITRMHNLLLPFTKTPALSRIIYTSEGFLFFRVIKRFILTFRIFNLDTSSEN